MRKEKDFVISGRKVKMTHLEFATSMDVLTLLYKHLAGPMGSFFADGETVADAKQISNALKQLAQTLNSADLKYLVGIFAKATKIETNGAFVELEPELHLAGANLSFFPKWLLEAVMYNFGDFLKGAGLEDMRHAVSPAAQA